MTIAKIEAVSKPETLHIKHNLCFKGLKKRYFFVGPVTLKLYDYSCPNSLF